MRSHSIEEKIVNYKFKIECLIHVFHCIDRITNQPIDHLIEIETLRVFPNSFDFQKTLRISIKDLLPFRSSQLRIAHRQLYTKLQIFQTTRWQNTMHDIQHGCLPSSSRKPKQSKVITVCVCVFIIYCVVNEQRKSQQNKKKITTKTIWKLKVFSVDFSDNKTKEANKHTHKRIKRQLNLKHFGIEFNIIIYSLYRIIMYLWGKRNAVTSYRIMET